MHAELIWDGVNSVNIPRKMGIPRDDQCLGKPHDAVCELAGRVCYDSLGTGRPTSEYHKNIIRDSFLSIYEHAHFTVSMPSDNTSFAIALLNRPDVYVHVLNNRLRVTFNLRHVLEWDVHPVVHVPRLTGPGVLREIAYYHARELAPTVFSDPWSPSIITQPWLSDTQVVAPELATEKFLTFYLEGSRVWSHEMVRHRHNMSQRSGRYCNEEETPYELHPLLLDFLIEQKHKGITKWSGWLQSEEKDDKEMYCELVSDLQTYLQTKTDPMTAKKQARSIGRYYLGNGLGTAMVYTASAYHWRHIFNLRCSPHADAEIRTLMEQVQSIAKASYWGKEFA